MVYEIKSGNHEKKLTKEMKKRCYFIYQFLKTIFNRPIYYEGFSREKEINPILSFDLEEEKIFTEEKKILNKNNMKEEETKIKKIIMKVN